MTDPTNAEPTFGECTVFMNLEKRIYIELSGLEVIEVGRSKFLPDAVEITYYASERSAWHASSGTLRGAKIKQDGTPGLSRYSMYLNASRVPWLTALIAEHMPAEVQA